MAMRSCEVTNADPVLGAFADVEWRIGESAVEPGQQLVLVTDGIIEAAGEGGRFGEERLRAELAGAGNPAHAVQRLEGALQLFHRRSARRRRGDPRCRPGRRVARFRRGARAEHGWT